MEQLKQQLIALGYDARAVNGDCFDIHQDGHIHYLSFREATALANTGRLIRIANYGERSGLNTWYNFNEAQ